MEKPMNGHQTCEYLGVSYPTLLRYIKQGLPCSKPAGRLFFFQSKIDEWLQRQ
jgi:predicted site-specific integrase-resolvase